MLNPIRLARAPQDAELKIFLTASPEERAQRRFEELRRNGTVGDATYESVLADVNTRDGTDFGRAAGGLKIVDDAVQVDTTGESPRGS